MTRLTSTDLIEANREKLLEWAAERRSLPQSNLGARELELI